MDFQNEKLKKKPHLWVKLNEEKKNNIFSVMPDSKV